MFHQNRAQDDFIDKFRSLLEDYNLENGIQGEDLIHFSDEQKRAIQLFDSGKNVLVLGAGGTGKSKLIKEIKYQTHKKHPTKKIIITATTGIAAYNINGITINSFMGIGTGEQNVDILLKRIRRKIGIRERIRNTDILVIDEISMASAELFEKINTICQSIRKSAAPFGGIQVLLTGDLLQLLPVFNKNSVLFTEQDTRLIFESPVFKRYFTDKNTVNLVYNFRQNERDFVDMLLRIRKGEPTKSDISLLKSRLLSKLKITKEQMESAVHLVSSNKQAQVINLTNLNQLDDQGFKYKSKFTHEGEIEMCEELTKELMSQFNQKGITEIHLKKGARVMLIKNLSVEDGLVNGSVGTVESFQEMDDTSYPMVKFDNGVRRLILPVDWELEMGKSVARAMQLPLMLSWALTIHKSQSLTLNSAILDLGDCFCDGQVYVALSRVKSLSGLFLNTFSEHKITANTKVLEYLGSIRGI